MSEHDYRISHRAPGIGSGAPLHDLEEVYPDVYDRPDLYAHEGTEGVVSVIMAARGKPDAMVRMYRSVPAGVSTINTGDWVAVTEQYAAQSGFHDTDPALDLPVIAVTVRADQLYGNGDSLAEWGYIGPPIEADTIAPS